MPCLGGRGLVSFRPSIAFTFMGGGKNKKKNGNSKSGKRHGGNKKGGGGLSGFLSNPTLFPARRVGTMVYDTILALSPAATSIAYNTYRANSVYDPDFTGVGTTASGYGTMATLYNRYRVLRVSITLNATSASTLPGTLFVIATPLNTVGTSYSAIMSQKYVWTRQLSCVNASGVSHRLAFPVERIYGTTRAAVLAEDDFAAITGTSPNNVVFLHVGVYNNTGTAFTTQIQCMLRFSFLVEWSLPLMTT